MSHTGNWSNKILHCVSTNARAVQDTSKMSTATFGLTKPLQCPDDYGMYISCISANIPYSFWSIPNPIVINFTYGAGNTAANLTIAAGNPSAVQVATMLTHSNSGLVCTYSTLSGCFTFAVGATNQITFPAQPNLAYIGVPVAGKSIPAGALAYQAPLTPKISGPRAIMVNTNIPLDVTSAGCGNAQTLCFVPVDVEPGNFIIYKPYSWARQVVKTNYIPEIVVSLCDESGAALDLKGQDWSIDLCFELLVPPDMQNQTFTELPGGGTLYDALRRTPEQTKKYVAL